MKLKELVANEEAMKELVTAKFENPQLAWDLSESFDVVEKAIKKFHDKRSEYIKANGKPNEENPEQFQMNDPEEFQKEMIKLLEVNVKVEFPEITIEDLKGVPVSPRDIAAYKHLGILKSAKK